MKPFRRVRKPHKKSLYRNRPLAYSTRKLLINFCKPNQLFKHLLDKYTYKDDDVYNGYDLTESFILHQNQVPEK